MIYILGAPIKLTICLSVTSCVHRILKRQKEKNIFSVLVKELYHSKVYCILQYFYINRNN